MMSYEPIWVMSGIWLGLLGLSLWKNDVLLTGGASLTGFILGLTVHSVLSSSLGGLLGVIIVIFNSGLLVRLLFLK